MKKNNLLSTLLCLAVLLQCLLLPVSATAVTEASGAGAAQALPVMPQETEPPAFGTVSIQKGCRTINGLVPLAGSDPRLATAQSVFLYEATTDTVVYAYNHNIEVKEAVRRMLPKNKIGDKMLTKLHVYAGAEHPHAAQKPEVLTF